MVMVFKQNAVQTGILHNFSTQMDINWSNCGRFN